MIDELLQANRRYARTFDAADLASPPTRQLAVLTCMDARMDPHAFLGLAPGEAHVIRNAGGRASDDALRSLIVSTHLLGTRTITVIHHTDCGMATFTNQELQARLARDAGADAGDIDFLPIDSLEASARTDAERIRQAPLLPDDVTVAAFLYDVTTGLLDRLV